MADMRQCLCVLCKHEWQMDISAAPPTMPCPGCNVQALTREFIRAARKRRESVLARRIMAVFMAVFLTTAGILGYVHFETAAGAVTLAVVALACVGLGVAVVRWPWLFWWLLG